MARHFHLTPIENLQSILKDGLIPSIGARSAKIKEQDPAIYLFTDARSCDEACMNWFADLFVEGSNLVALAIDIDGQSPNENVEYEVVVREVISPTCISVVCLDALEQVDLESILDKHPSRRPATVNGIPDKQKLDMSAVTILFPVPDAAQPDNVPAKLGVVPLSSRKP